MRGRAASAALFLAAALHGRQISINLNERGQTTVVLTNDCGFTSERNLKLKILVALLVIVGLAAAFWYFRDEVLPKADVPVVALPMPAPEMAPQPSTPMHPIEPAAATEPEPLPPLDDSDSGILSALVDVLGNEVESLLVSEALIDRFVATVDNLPRAHVSEKIRPVGRLPTQFVATSTPDDELFVLGPDNYHRYDALVDLLVNADIDSVVATYRRFYPLFQESYERLGYPDAYFNDRLIEVIDHLLATPERQESVKLVRPHVLYQFADPDLEALSSGEKLLLRMGNEHALRVKEVLREFRSHLG